MPTASAYNWGKEYDLYYFMDWLLNLGAEGARRLFNSRLLSLNLDAIVDSDAELLHIDQSLHQE